VTVELQLFLWWVAFGGTHVLGSSVPVRTRLIRVLGLLGFKGLYSVVALATFTPLLVLYWDHRHEGALLFDPPLWTRHVTEVLMFCALQFVVHGAMTPGPATTRAELSGRFQSTARGIQRITRHPMNTGFGLFGLAHMLSNPTVGDWIFWGGWVVFAVVSALHQDRRSLASGPPQFKTYYAETSLVPFAAILAGRQHLVLGELRWRWISLATALFGVIRWIHPGLIGGFS